MRRIPLFILLLFSYVIGFTQVTIGSGEPPTYGALLELKTQQARTTTDPNSDDNITSTKGGFLLPRVKLVSTSSLSPFIEVTNQSNEVKASLAGLMVYNLNGQAPFETGIYVWDGALWLTGGFTKVAQNMSIANQPKAFSFYETGEETATEVADLVFEVNPIIDVEGNIIQPVYQWYRMTGNNVHVRVGTPISGATAKNYNPRSIIIKGTTRNANNTGFYRFYCEATGGGTKLTSDVVEVAVGCGAKNNAGEWLSFMCFNLGADIDMTINRQKTTIMSAYSYSTTTGVHTYVADEEKVWGDFYQWGRITDGHEKRNSTNVAKGALSDAEIVTGKKCSSTDTGRPYQQVAKTATNWYGNFITNAISPSNWHPNTTQSTLDMLWRTSRFVSNDPCTHFKVDGSMHEFWHEGIDQTSEGVAACSEAGTGWRTPQQEEWGAIYKGGSLGGSPNTSTANSWIWYMPESGATDLTLSRGYEIRPDNITTTLFLPSSGFRGSSAGNAQLYYQGANGRYWSANVVGTNVHALHFNSSNVNPAYNAARSFGFALRCIKNN